MNNSFKNGEHPIWKIPCEVYNKNACNDYGKKNKR